MSFVTLQYLLPTPLAQNGTVTLTYPTGYKKNNWSGSPGQHELIAGQNFYAAPVDFTLTFGDSNITFTWLKPLTIPAGTQLKIDADIAGEPDPQDGSFPVGVKAFRVVEVSVGNPVAVSATGVCASQAVAAPGNLVLATTAGVNMDVARTVSIVSASAGDDNTKGLKVEGYNGAAKVSETILFNGVTTRNGKKAFTKVTRVYAPAALAGNVSVGWSKVFGLPTFLGSPGHVVHDMVDGVKAGTAGTFVAADIAASSLTSGDVRGTFTPNGTPDGSLGFSLLMLSSDPSFAGGPQNGWQ